MLSERNLNRQSEQTYEDSQNIKQGDVTGFLIKAGVIGATSMTMYHTGLLRPVMKSLFEISSKLSQEGTERAGTVMHSIKKWSRLKQVSPNALKSIKDGNFARPSSPSIFRERDSSLMYDLMMDAKDLIESGNTNFSRVRRIMAGSEEDLKVLHAMMDADLSSIELKRKNYKNTTLGHRLNELNYNIRTLSEKSNEVDAQSQMAFNNLGIRSLLEKMSMTDKEIEEELRLTGTHHIRLKDVVEIKKGTERGTVLEIKENAPIDISQRGNNKESLIDYINRTFAHSAESEYIDENGVKRSIYENIGDLIIDNSIRMTDKGKVLDYRMTKQDLTGFLRSLSNDFGLPVVGFNPFKTLFGLDKFGVEEPLMAIISPNQYDPNITKIGGHTKTIGDWLGETFGDDYRSKPVGIFNGKAYVAGLDKNGLKISEIADNLSIRNITYADTTHTLKPLHNAMRQMSGLGVKEFNLPESYEDWISITGAEATRFGKFKYEVLGNMFGIGRTDIAAFDAGEFMTLDFASSPDRFTNEFLEKITEPLTDTYKFGMDLKPEELMSMYRTYDFKSTFGSGLMSYESNGKIVMPKMYTTVKKSYNLFDALKYYNKGDKELGKETLEGFIKQFSPFEGMRPDGTITDHFTQASAMTWFVPEQLSQGLNVVGLGLQLSDKRNAAQSFYNLIMKRALPFYLLTKVPDMLNYFSEPFMGQDEDGNRDNITKALVRNVVKPIDIGAHALSEFVGLTNVFKGMKEYVPGYDQIEETLDMLPFLPNLGLDQTKQEREEYIERGVDPVRKGRFWGSGNTPWTGDKIMYYRPNLYRRIQADVEFSDSKYGSRQEYFNNTWFPNPINPLAPINHFILDRNHYDKKHYYDRPYLETAPEGSRMPLFGPIFGATIGSIINPPQRMHKEYWQNNLQLIPGDEEPSTLLTEGYLPYKGINLENVINIVKTPQTSISYDNSKIDMNTFAKIQRQSAQSFASDKASQDAAREYAKTFVSRPSVNTNWLQISYPFRTYDRYDNPYEVYTTPSGGTSVVDVPDDINIYNLNKTLKEWSLNKIPDIDYRVDLNEGIVQDKTEQRQRISDDFMMGVGEQYNWLSEVAGLRGFFARTITGNPLENTRKIENSGYTYSASRDFWNQDLGGLGGELSEIFRRFIPKEDKNIEQINPIRNTMPQWMPGSEYFTDFKHGDPYIKVQAGEERLPGEGYERLWGIKGIANLNIGSSSIGYDKDYIVRHMLNQNDVKSSFEQETLEKGTEIHKKIEKAWKEVGIAFSTEGQVKDERNKIIGYYDAMVYDASSPTGQAIVDIKTTSAKKLEEIRKSGKPLDHHRRQVNWYLWGTGNTDSKGYIYYVDKENLNNTYTVGFNYDEGLLKDTLKNVYNARKEIWKGLETGEIGRGDLYSNMDKYRILADVAPYSQEFKDVQVAVMNEINNMGDGTSETARKRENMRKQAQEIRERVTAQKEPFRVYDYKFSTANLKHERVTVKEILDNNTIITEEYGKQHAIKFAGIRVSESGTQLYNPHEETYTDKGGRKRKHMVGKSKREVAENEIHKYVHKGMKIDIGYTADEDNKFSKDSTQSIRAVIKSKGVNLNQRLLNMGLATEKEDDSPAGIHARYTSGQIAFGSAMETITHKFIGNIPFIGSKILQVRSPYERYKEREVYGKDFQSWSNPISGILQPQVERVIGNTMSQSIGKNIFDIGLATFIGSLFGRNTYGKIIGGVIGGVTVGTGKLLSTGAWLASPNKGERDWRPKRRRDQEELNEYVDVLKFVKANRLYEKYKKKAQIEDNFDVESYMKSQQHRGQDNKARIRELKDYKKKVKLDFEHRSDFRFKHGENLYKHEAFADHEMSQRDVVSVINKEIKEIQSQRKVTKLPKNALKAIEYKNQADNTMYGFEKGDSLVNIMMALPKKDRQYYKYFMNAPEEEKDKILRIAPSYLRRALQSTWGREVDEKPRLDEYFTHHALPDQNWIGWREDVDMDTVKVKIVDKQDLDPGEFDIWENNIEEANKQNIPIPKIHKTNNLRSVQLSLMRIMGDAGMRNVQVDIGVNSHTQDNRTNFRIQEDMRPYIEQQIQNMEV